MTRPWLLIASTGVVVGGLFGPWGAIACVVVAVVASVMARQRWVLVAVIAACAALAGVLRVGMDTVSTVSPEVVASSEAEAVVVGNVQVGPSGPRAVVRVERVRDDGQWAQADGEVLVFFQQTAPGGITRGDELRLVWSVTPLDGYDADFRRFIAASDAAAGATAFRTTVLERGASPANLLTKLRNTVTDRIHAAIEGDAGALLAGFVTGDDSRLSEDTRNAFERTNTSHITAVSGSNVAVLLSIWYVLMPTRRLQRGILALVGIVLLIWLYVILVGFGPGAVRAGLFATILLPAARFGRRADPLTALMLASALMVLANPGYAGDVGFWLSLSASAAIATTVAVGQDREVSLLRLGVIGLVAAQVATLPVTLSVFDTWSPSSFVANLLLGPLVSAIFPFAFVTAGLVTLLPWLGGAIGWLPAIGANTIIAIVQSLDGAFPTLRSGVSDPASIVLIAVLSLAVIGVLSVDAHRFIRRVAWHSPAPSRIAIPIAVGASAGIWLGTVAFALLR